MVSPLVRAGICRALAIALALLPSAGSAGAAERAWQPADSIPVRYFVGPSSGWSHPGAAGETQANSSPDGRSFFVVTKAGDLGCDCNRYRLIIFSYADIARALAAGAPAPAPVATFERASGSNRPAIQGPAWTSDSSAIVFLSPDRPDNERAAFDGANRQLFMARLADRRLIALSEAGRDVISFDEDGGRIAFVAADGGTFPFRRPPDYPATRYAPSDIGAILGAGPEAAPTFSVFSVRVAEPARQILPLAPRTGSALWTSPDGRRGIMLGRSPAVPANAAWDYDAATRRPNELGPVDSRYLLLDLERGRGQAALDAPAGLATSMGRRAAAEVPGVTRAIWSPDGTRVALLNTALPHDDGQSERRTSAYVAMLEVETGLVRPVATMVDGQGIVSDLMFVGNERVRLIRRNGSSTVAIDLVMSGGGWRRASPAMVATVPGPPMPRIAIRENANRPAMLVAEADGHAIELLPPDPALDGLARAQAETVEWRESDGRTVRGLLMLPRREPGAAPPALVIQAYHFLPDLFRPDGAYSSPYAAQALVARGLAVLQLDIPVVDRGETGTTPAEFRAMADRIDSAVGVLDARGLIDPLRVGMMGHSRAGYMTTWALTHPGRYRIAAGINSDGFTGSFANYLLQMATDDSDRRYDAMTGGLSFWQDPEAWLALAPEFTVNRATGPYLLLTNHPLAAAWFNGMMGAFRRNRRPFDWLNFPDGQHPLVRPRERLESMTIAVDWMDFWLAGHENPDPSREGQYRLWRAMRDDWRRQLAWEAAGHPLGSAPSGDFAAPAGPEAAAQRPRS